MLPHAMPWSKWLKSPLETSTRVRGFPGVESVQNWQTFSWHLWVLRDSLPLPRIQKTIWFQAFWNASVLIYLFFWGGGGGGGHESFIQKPMVHVDIRHSIVTKARFPTWNSAQHMELKSIQKRNAAAVKFSFFKKKKSIRFFEINSPPAKSEKVLRSWPPLHLSPDKLARRNVL